MFELLFDNTSLPVLGEVMSFSERRQQVLAHNVANINTPGFRATDLPVEAFTSALSDAIANRDERTPHRFGMPRAARGGRDGRGGRGWARVAAEPVSGLMNYYDGASRSIEALQSQMLKNALWHEAAVKLYTHQSSLLATAIREKLA